MAANAAKGDFEHTLRVCEQAIAECFERPFPVPETFLRGNVAERQAELYHASIFHAQMLGESLWELAQWLEGVTDRPSLTNRRPRGREAHRRTAADRNQ